MKHLVILAHHNSKSSFCAAVAKARVESLKERDLEVKFVSLSDDNFNPLLGAKDFEYMAKGDYAPDVKPYMELIKWADKISVVFPMWWGTMPALMKGFFDRVLAYEFAYKYGENGVEGLLKGKRAEAIVTTGNPHDYLLEHNIIKALDNDLKVSIFEFCGIEYKQTHYFNAVTSITNEEREIMLKQIYTWKSDK